MLLHPVHRLLIVMHQYQLSSPLHLQVTQGHPCSHLQQLVNVRTHHPLTHMLHSRISQVNITMHQILMDRLHLPSDRPVRIVNQGRLKDLRKGRGLELRNRSVAKLQRLWRLNTVSVRPVRLMRLRS